MKNKKILKISFFITLVFTIVTLLIFNKYNNDTAKKINSPILPDYDLTTKTTNTTLPSRMISSDNHPLVIHASEGNVDKVKNLLREGDFTRNNFITALGEASSKGFTDIIEVLINDSNTDIDTATYAFAFSSAMYNEKMEALVTLINHLPDITTMHIQLIEVLFLAIEKNHMGVLIALVNRDMNINVSNSSNVPALNLAAKLGHTEQVSYMLTDANCDPNIKDKQGITPLMIASLNGKDEIVELLIKDIRTNEMMFSNQRYTALSLASTMGHEKIVESLIEKIYPDSSMVTIGSVQHTVYEGAISAAKDHRQSNIVKMLRCAVSNGLKQLIFLCNF